MASKKKGIGTGNNPNSRKGKKNLKVIRSKEDARKKGRNGGIASGKVRRAKRDFWQRFETLSTHEVNKDIKDTLIKQFSDLKKYKGDVVIEDAVIYRIIQGATKGDKDYIKIYLSVIKDFKPTNNIENIEQAQANENELLEAINKSAKEVWNETE